MKHKLLARNSDVKKTNLYRGQAESVKPTGTLQDVAFSQNFDYGFERENLL